MSPVFPAHAGMDRLARARGTRFTGFPRPRGDGPPSGASFWNHWRFSPPTRGWTGRILWHAHLCGVFPAHAGMDRLFGMGLRAGWCFPRPRGDGPQMTAREVTERRFSPPTRGWTLLMPMAFIFSRVFPAHAGMDRGGLGVFQGPLRFPRPRGDGPDLTVNEPRTGPFSPPTRGWTAFATPMGSPDSVFPAHAGMDRAGWITSPTCTSFPRPRGDGPHFQFIGHHLSGFSPPTRGWTDKTGGQGGVCGIFPAHAGMDRKPPSCRPSPVRFPRPRGDGPAPVLRGNVVSEFSPPTRGWTARPLREHGRRFVFPAHAGMDRPAENRAGGDVCFPRPRGDGPARFMRGETSAGFSPPTRGWTGRLPLP
ncbi:MAG: hypothetical protein JWM59_2416 [Verrucomicrobiales bacterium]|nr:hypothetical protein [Verrucomicrobiales bacterium]